MKIAIIGGGITGLTAAYELAKKGHRVTIFEKEKTLGGLAGGFKQKDWQWHLESAYHHLFTNDTAILNLIKELGLEHALILTRPVTANYYKEKIYQFDSPIHLLRSPVLSPIAKIRTALLIVFLKINPFWQPLESVTAETLIRTIGGNEAWNKLWEPLLTAKFGAYASSIAASWFWARIKKRTPKLYYIEGGFHTLISTLEKAIIQHGGTIKKNCTYTVSSRDAFDRLLLTIHTPTAIPHLHAQILILETKEPILKNVYWLNITDRTFPFLAVVAHTNMIDKKYYGGHHLTYFGNYLPEGHPYLSMTKKQLLHVFLPYIKRLNPRFHWSDLSDWSDLFIGYFAQPVHELHYSARAPTLETSIKNVYLANLDSIYPWDRGTNYAVELGQRAARVIMS